MEFSKSQRGNSVLTVGGFEYNKFRENTSGITTWRCRQYNSYKCKAWIKTRDVIILGEMPTHCHDSCPQKAKANICMSKMKDSIQQVGATARNVMENEFIGLNSLDKDTLAHLPKLSSIARCLLRHQNGDHRSNPNLSLYSGVEKVERIFFKETMPKIETVASENHAESTEGSSDEGEGPYSNLAEAKTTQFHQNNEQYLQLLKRVLDLEEKNVALSERQLKLEEKRIKEDTKRQETIINILNSILNKLK